VKISRLLPPAGALLVVAACVVLQRRSLAALTLCIESAALFKDDRLGGHVISPVLALWAKTDPLAALEWVRTKAPKHPDLITDDAKRGLLSGTAVQDPALAFKRIGELGFKDTNNAISNIVNAANSPEERTATLAALRSHLATLTDDAAKTTATTLSRYEPEAAAQWALTLPPGKDRDETLNQIYHAWPKTDPAAIEAADAFARQHGLK
jgi:hypothetical protein